MAFGGSECTFMHVRKWYAAGGGIARLGPFKTEFLAWQSMILVDLRIQKTHVFGLNGRCNTP